MEPKPCPICGAKAYIMHDVVDGFDFGWSVGCPRFKLDDGIHGIDETTQTIKAEFMRPRVMHCISRQSAIELWNKKVEDMAET